MQASVRCAIAATCARVRQKAARNLLAVAVGLDAFALDLKHALDGGDRWILLLLLQLRRYGPGSIKASFDRYGVLATQTARNTASLLNAWEACPRTRRSH
jgi:hypothetical protein